MKKRLTSIIDLYGHQLNLGDLVAYNYSGQLRKGILRDITYKVTNDQLKYVFHIQLICPSRKPSNKISKVSRLSNLFKLVI